MAFVRFDPYKTFENAARKMNELWGDFDKGIGFEVGGFAPRVDITEDETNIRIYAEMSGLTKEDVKVSINDENALIIKGMKKQPDKKDNVNFIRNERTFGEFSRSFLLPQNVDKNSIAAKFENGLLEITLTKIQPEKPKEYEVNIL
ncbi:MAG: molecular chaperone [Ignavibacteria bacterium]|nr:molecular chaperone [Ignavibacteria bacterium]